MTVPRKLNVLILGSGGREHALAWKIARSPHVGKLFVLPGNAGTASVATNVPGDAADVNLALDVARRENIDLTIVGPEDPLAAGVADAFAEQKRRIFGPSRAAAQLESDKAYAKHIMRQHAVPTAESRVFTDYALAKQYIATRDEALVVKAAGLARGKGVIVCDDPSDAILAAERMLEKGDFGAAGKQIVVEERLHGPEVSILAFVDGRTIYILEPAQDHKRLGDEDAGPNTGGMGAFCPAPLTDDVHPIVESQVFVPTIDALVRENVHYTGVLYAGLILTTAGPKVLEFNCRMGDPEAQAMLVRMRSDLLEVLDLATRGKLDEARIAWDPRAALCVVMAAQGYPDKPRTGDVISGLKDAESGDDVVVFHAGAKRNADGAVVTAGGRVLGVTALGETLAAARETAYNSVQKIHFDGAIYRRDLGAR